MKIQIIRVIILLWAVVFAGFGLMVVAVFFPFTVVAILVALFVVRHASRMGYVTHFDEDVFMMNMLFGKKTILLEDVRYYKVSHGDWIRHRKGITIYLDGFFNRYTFESDDEGKLFQALKNRGIEERLILQ